MSDQCSVCLGEFDEPVCIPCGHVYCIGCITDVVNRQDNGGVDTAAKCPTCRSEFQLVVPDLTYLPRKYHPFIVPPLRRVYLPAMAATATQDELDEALELIGKLETDLTRYKEKLKKSQDSEQNLLRQYERQQNRARYYKDKEAEGKLEMTRLGEACVDFDRKTKDLEDQVRAKQRRVDDLEKQLRQSDARVKSLQDEVEDFEEEVHQLRNREAKLQRNVNDLQDQVLGLQDETDLLVEGNQELDETIQSLREKLQEYEMEEADIVQREKEARDDERRKAKKRIAALERDLKHFDDQNWDSRCKDLEDETEHLKAENRKLREAARLSSSDAGSSPARVVRKLPKRRRTAGEETFNVLHSSVPMPRNFFAPPDTKRARIDDFCHIIGPRAMYANY